MTPSRVTSVLVLDGAAEFTRYDPDARLSDKVDGYWTVTVAEPVVRLERIRLAWNAGDARAYAEAFTEDATHVIFLGEPLLGREAIERNHIDVLTKWRKGTKMAIKAISAKSLGDDVASILTIGGLGGTTTSFTTTCKHSRLSAAAADGCAPHSRTPR